MDITELSKVDDNKYTALHWAATYGQEKVCELLMLLIIMAIPLCIVQQRGGIKRFVSY